MSPHTLILEPTSLDFSGHLDTRIGSVNSSKYQNMSLNSTFPRNSNNLNHLSHSGHPGITTNRRSSSVSSSSKTHPHNIFRASVDQKLRQKQRNKARNSSDDGSNGDEDEDTLNSSSSDSENANSSEKQEKKDCCGCGGTRCDEKKQKKEAQRLRQERLEQLAKLSWNTRKSADIGNKEDVIDANEEKQFVKSLSARRDSDESLIEIEFESEKTTVKELTIVEQDLQSVEPTKSTPVRQLQW